MFFTLLRRELLANLMAFRFFVATVVCLLLVVANSIVLIEDYERRLADYNISVQTHRNQAVKARSYSTLELNVDRPPNPLSIFNQGLDRRLGNTINIYHGVVPSIWDAESHSADNPFLNLFSSVDLVFIFQVVLGLLALFFAHDAIAGERDEANFFEGDREDRDGWEVRLSFNFPLFDGGRTESLREVENAELERLQLDLTDLQKQIRVDVRRAYRQVANARERMEIEQRRVQIFEQRLRTIERVLDEGLDLPSYRGLTFDDAFEAQAQFTEAQRVFYQTKRDYASAKERLRQTIGWIE